MKLFLFAILLLPVSFAIPVMDSDGFYYDPMDPANCLIHTISGLLIENYMNMLKVIIEIGNPTEVIILKETITEKFNQLKFDISQTAASSSVEIKKCDEKNFKITKTFCRFARTNNFVYNISKLFGSFTQTISTEIGKFSSSVAAKFSRLALVQLKILKAYASASYRCFAQN